MYGKKEPNAKGGFRDDLGHYVRSSWEADFARVLKYNGLDYDYEPEQFELTLDDGRTVHYTPDFYVKSLDTWFEIKGFMRDMDAMKIKAWQKKFPGRKLIIIDKEPFAQIQMKYSDLVIWECPEIPSSFGYVTIESIEFLKHDDTYDIIMNGSERNFIANGFVVHNSGMQALFKRMHPKKFEDIQASVALYRPGPMEWTRITSMLIALPVKHRRMSSMNDWIKCSKTVQLMMFLKIPKIWYYIKNR